jgi:hypothetical protein
MGEELNTEKQISIRQEGIKDPDLLKRVANT